MAEAPETLCRTTRMKPFGRIVAAISFALSAPAAAQLSVDVDGSIEKDLVIAVPAMPTPQASSTAAGPTDALGRQIAEVIAADLKGSGLFKPLGPGGVRAIGFDEVTAPQYDGWSGMAAEALVQGFVRANADGGLTVGCYLYDVGSKSELTRQGYEIAARDWRRNRVLLLDYDGTLAPIAELPSLAAPNQQLLTLLRRLVDAPGTAVHIVTGRSQDSIEPWLGGLPLWLHVEHGLRSRKPDGTWLPSLRERPQVIETASRIMLKYVQRLRGSFVETKAASVAFHYRRANPLVALEVLTALRQEVERVCPEVQLLDGHKVLELRQSGVSKNVAVNIALEHAPEGSVILAAGDDRTDEDMFAALPPGALSIRVGTGTSAARLRVESSRALLGLLSRLL